MHEIEMLLGKREEVSPGRFLKILAERGGDIQHVHIQPPKVGGRGFGRLVVEYRRGAFRSAFPGLAARG